jgi:hypothetical protein
MAQALGPIFFLQKIVYTESVILSAGSKFASLSSQLFFQKIVYTESVILRAGSTFASLSSQNLELERGLYNGIQLPSTADHQLYSGGEAESSASCGFSACCSLTE